MAVMVARAVSTWIPPQADPPPPTFFAPWLKGDGKPRPQATNDELLAKFKQLTARQAHATRDRNGPG